MPNRPSLLLIVLLAFVPARAGDAPLRPELRDHALQDESTPGSEVIELESARHSRQL